MPFKHISARFEIDSIEFGFETGEDIYKNMLTKNVYIVQ